MKHSASRRKRSPQISGRAVLYQGHVIIRGPIKLNGDGTASIVVASVDDDGQWPYLPKIGNEIRCHAWAFL